MSPINLTSDVRRDLIQSAQIFRTAPTAVWEYVTNSLEYVDRGIAPEVMVSLDQRKKTIAVTDNGSGMDLSELNHFFQMHGENPGRKAGRFGRGLFGTTLVQIRFWLRQFGQHAGGVAAERPWCRAPKAP